MDVSAVPEDISNVHFFQIVLNEYFDASLPLLASKQYFNKDMLANNEFEDVKEREKETCAVPK